MLQNSSQLLIAAIAIHETLHAVINYNIVWGGYNVDRDESWMSGINSWSLINGVPVDFRDHYEMMDYYFNQVVSLLAQWDNNRNTPKVYQMAMMIGLNNPGTASNNPNFASQQQILQTEYDNLKTKYNITESDLDAFKIANNNAIPSAKLPQSGCN